MEKYVKETILSILLLLISVCSFGQKGDKLTDKGYHGEISVSSIFLFKPIASSCNQHHPWVQLWKRV